MELDITNLFNDCETTDFQDSVANSGLTNIGEITWQRALDNTSFKPLFAESDCDEVRDYIRTFGGLEDEEIDAWSYNELQALILQDISSHLSDFDMVMNDVYEDWVRGEHEPDWKAWEDACNEGQVSGNIGEGIDGKIYFSLY